MNTNTAVKQATPTLGDLRVDAVLTAASEATGLDDFGEQPFIEGLTIFLQDLRENAALNAQGIVLQYQEIVRMLSNRLGYVRDIKRHPEIIDEKVEKPIIIIGLTRTGSSHLQRLLSADPGVQRLERWRLENPAPIAGSTGIEPDPRIAMSKSIEEMTMVMAPALMACHAMEAREPDEELTLLEAGYANVVCSLKVHAPLHRAWADTQVAHDISYDWLYRMLQFLQWQDRRRGVDVAGKPWIMKCPLHTGIMETVVRTFPDATFAYTHRDLHEAIPSMFSTMELIRVFFSNDVDLNEIGDAYLRFYAREVQRHLDFRQRFGADNIIDVYYEDICRKPEQVVADIFAHAGRSFTDAARVSVAQYSTRRPKNHFGRHEYSVERYGQSNAAIDAAFAAYEERFPRVKSRAGR